jgi:hypothetical protein
MMGSHDQWATALQAPVLPLFDTATRLQSQSWAVQALHADNALPSSSKARFVHWAPSLEQAGGVHAPDATMRPLKPILKARTTATLAHVAQADHWSSCTVGTEDASPTNHLAQEKLGGCRLRIKLVNPKKRSRDVAWG